MTIEEAIEKYSHNAEYERTNGNLQGCLAFRQLAEWLKDYKRLLEQEPILDKIRAEMQFYSNSFVLAGRNDLASAVSYCIEIIDKYRQEG